MQTAPATSQKTPKVANDDFLPADETHSAAANGRKATGKTATSKNTTRASPAGPRWMPGQ